MRNFNRLAIIPAAAVGFVGATACDSATKRPADSDGLSNVHYIGPSKIGLPGEPDRTIYNAANFGAPVKNGPVEIGTNGYGEPLDGGFGVKCIVNGVALRIMVGQQEVNGAPVATSFGDVPATPDVVAGAQASQVPDC